MIPCCRPGVVYGVSQRPLGLGAGLSYRFCDVYVSPNASPSSLASRSFRGMPLHTEAHRRPAYVAQGLERDLCLRVTNRYVVMYPRCLSACKVCTLGRMYLYPLQCSLLSQSFRCLACRNLPTPSASKRHHGRLEMLLLTQT
jgi:hypothetical protein